MAQQPAVHELVGRLLRYPPPSLHLVILTRRDPNLALSSLRAHHRLLEIGPEDLRFDRRQTAAFMENALGLSFSGPALARLHSSTEGWPVSLRLAAVALRHGGDAEELIRGLGGDSGQIREYLVEEILASQPAEIRQSLYKISILERFCAPLCESVCGPRHVEGETPHCAPAFDGLLRGAGLLTVPLDADREWCRFHHLFQELLKRQLERRTSAAERAALHRRASAWLARSGLIEEALHHALASGDEESAARLVAKHGDRAVNREQWARLDRWLAMLPAAILDQDPRLLVLKAYCLDQRFDYAQAFDALDRAESLLPAETRHLNPSGGDCNPDRRLRGEIAALRSDQCYMAAEGDLAVTRAERALALLPSEAQSARGHAMIILGASLQMVGHLDRAREILHQALAHRSLPQGTFHSRLLTTLCWVDWMAGDLPALGQEAARLLRLGEEWELAESRDFGRYFLGVFHYQRNQLADAERYLVPLVAEPCLTRTELYVHGSFALALAHVAQGRDREASELGDAVLAHLLEIGNAYALPTARAFLAELDLRRGDVARAAHWADSAPSEPLLPMYMFYVPELTRAKVWIARGGSGRPDRESPAMARELLSRLGDYLTRTHNRRFLIDVLATEALLHDASGDRAAAEEALERALTLALPGGLVRAFVDLGPPLAAVLDRLDLDREASRHAGGILAALRDTGTGDIPPAPLRGDAEGSAKLARDVGAAGFGPLPEPLSRREVEVLVLLSRRLTNREIGAELGISLGTVKRHVHNLTGKLGVSGRRRVVARASEIGILAAG